MTNKNLVDVFNIKKKVVVTPDVTDYEVFPDKEKLEELRTKIIQNLIDNTIPKNLSLEQEIKIEGSGEIIKLDFSDKRFVNKLLKLIKKYSNIEDELQREFSAVNNIEDPIDKLLAFSDIELKVLEDFKNDVNNTFNYDIVTKLFGDCVPAIERYFDLFESLAPFVELAKERENDVIEAINEKYSLNRIEDFEVDKED